MKWLSRFVKKEPIQPDPWEEFQSAVHAWSEKYEEVDRRARRHLVSSLGQLNDDDREAAEYAMSLWDNALLLLWHRLGAETGFRASFESWKQYLRQKQDTQPELPKQRRSKYSAELRAKVAALYAKQCTTKEINFSLGLELSPGQIIDFAREHGVQIRPRGQPRKSKRFGDELLRARYEQGATVRQVAKEFGISPYTARIRLIEAGTRLRPSGGGTKGERRKKSSPAPKSAGKKPLGVSEQLMTKPPPKTEFIEFSEKRLREAREPNSPYADRTRFCERHSATEVWYEYECPLCLWERAYIRSFTVVAALSERDLLCRFCRLSPCVSLHHPRNWKGEILVEIFVDDAENVVCRTVVEEIRKATLRRLARRQPKTCLVLDDGDS